MNNNYYQNYNEQPMYQHQVQNMPENYNQSQYDNNQMVQQGYAQNINYNNNYNNNYSNNYNNKYNNNYNQQPICDTPQYNQKVEQYSYKGNNNINIDYNNKSSYNQKSCINSYIQPQQNMYYEQCPPSYNNYNNQTQEQYYQNNQLITDNYHGNEQPIQNQNFLDFEENLQENQPLEDQVIDQKSDFLKEPSFNFKNSEPQLFQSALSDNWQNQNILVSSDSPKLKKKIDSEIVKEQKHFECVKNQIPQEQIKQNSVPYYNYPKQENCYNNQKAQESQMVNDQYTNYPQQLEKNQSQYYNNNNYQQCYPNQNKNENCINQISNQGSNCEIQNNYNNYNYNNQSNNNNYSIIKENKLQKNESYQQSNNSNQIPSSDSQELIEKIEEIQENPQIVMIQNAAQQEKDTVFKLKIEKKVANNSQKSLKQQKKPRVSQQIQIKVEEPECQVVQQELSESQLLQNFENQDKSQQIMDKKIASISQWYIQAQQQKNKYYPQQEIKLNIIQDKYLGEQFNEILKNKDILKICKRKKESNKNSQCQNMKKLIMNGILKYFQPHVVEQLTLIPVHLRQEILRVIQRLKESGKVEEKKKTIKMDVFSQPHFNILFLSLNRFSCCNMQKNQQNIDLHKDIFGIEINKFKSLDQDKLNYVNLIKEFIYVIAKKFLEQENPEDNEVVRGYKQRVVVSIKKMIAGNYIKKFQIYKNDKTQ